MNEIERERLRGLKDGILLGLIILAAADAETFWRELVDQLGFRTMRRHAALQGELELAGFVRYRQVRRR